MNRRPDRATGARSCRSPRARPSTIPPTSCKARFSPAAARCSSPPTAPARRSCSRFRSLGGKRASLLPPRPSIRSAPRCTPMARRWWSRAAAACGPLIAARLPNASSATWPGAELGECSISRDGEWLTAAYKRGAACGLAAGRFDGSGWHDHSVSRAPSSIRNSIRWSREWIEFAGDPAPRMHRVRRDGAGLECLLPARQRRIHCARDLPRRDRRPGLHRLAARPLPHGLDHPEIRTSRTTTPGTSRPTAAASASSATPTIPTKACRSSTPRTGARRQLCLSESSNQGTQWRAPATPLADGFRRRPQRNLSWMENAADTVYGPQWTHPHPSWSTDETQVAFASDRTGTTQVYVVEVP